jgi:hypothetical protein
VQSSIVDQTFVVGKGLIATTTTKKVSLEDTDRYDNKKYCGNYDNNVTVFTPEDDYIVLRNLSSILINVNYDGSC